MTSTTGTKRKRENGWAVVDIGGTYQTKFVPRRADARYDVEHTAHIQDGCFVIRRATLIYDISKPTPKKARRKP